MTKRIYGAWIEKWDEDEEDPFIPLGRVFVEGKYLVCGHYGLKWTDTLEEAVQLMHDRLDRWIKGLKEEKARVEKMWADPEIGPNG